MNFRINTKNNQTLNNSSTPLILSTYDGSGQVVHPCVIDFENEFGMEKWGGYRYWMIVTPYPYSNDSMENPCLYASEDGISWVVPKGISNPLDYAQGGWKKGFNNDPDMIYNPEEDKLFIYFRFANNKELKVKLIKINKDMKHDKIITVMAQTPWDHSTNKNRSLCVWREASDKWHMWGGGGAMVPPYNIYYFFSKDGFNWGEPKLCLNQQGVDPLQTRKMYNWHMSCKANYKENRIEFLCYSKESIGTVKKVARKVLRKIFRYEIKPKDAIIYAQCDMKAPTVFYLPLKTDILHTSRVGWDDDQLYRSSFQIYDTGKGYFYKVWYSALDKEGKWGLGLTSGTLDTKYSSPIL